MKRLFIIEDSLANKISYYLLAAFLIALPFDRFFSEWLLVVFCAHTLIHLKMESLQTLRNKNIWIAASIFIVSLLAITYSNYKSEGLKNNLQQLAILLFPVLLAVTNLNLAKYKCQLLEIFGLTCTITILYLYLEVFKVIHYFHLPLTSIVKKAFTNQNFTVPIGLHATYFAMYVLLSVCIFLFLFFRGDHSKKGKYILYSIVLLPGQVQLSSRATLIAAITIMVLIIPLFLLQGKKKVVFFLAALSFTTLIFVIITQVTSLKKRYIYDLENDLSEFRDPGDLTESRMSRWSLEWQLIQKSPLTGYGTGSEKFILKDTYFKHKFYRSYLLGLNAHNQFLSFLLNAGLIGLLVYLYLFYYALGIAIKRKDFLLLSFLLILLIVSFSENILDVSKGILFFGFFFSLLLLTDSNTNLRTSD
ncbi:MAG: O-antigen ligase family protein [Ginsengibacter sp.]